MPKITEQVVKLRASKRQTKVEGKKDGEGVGGRGRGEGEGSHQTSQCHQDENQTSLSPASLSPASPSTVTCTPVSEWLLLFQHSGASTLASPMLEAHTRNSPLALRLFLKC